MAKVKPNRQKNARPIVAVHVATPAARNRLRSSRGRSTRLSRAMKAPASAADAARPPRIDGVVQPICGPSMIEPTSSPRQAMASPIPTASNRPGWSSLDSGTRRGEAAATGSTMAMLIPNRDGQAKYCRSSPPTTGPSAMPSPAVAAHSPTARAWCPVPLKMVEMSDRVAGNTIAAQTPSSALSPISTAMPVVSAEARETTAKPSRPMIRTLRRPIRSPRWPPGSMSTANTRV